MPKKKDKFYFHIYESLKVIITKEARSHGSYILILKLQEPSPGCLADLFVSRLIYNRLLFNHQIFRVFSVDFTLFFVSHILFPPEKTASCSRYTHCHSHKLEFLSNLCSGNSHPLFLILSTIGLLNLLNSATTVLYHSSLALSLTSVR